MDATKYWLWVRHKEARYEDNYPLDGFTGAFDTLGDAKSLRDKDSVWMCVVEVKNSKPTGVCWLFEKSDRIGEGYNEWRPTNLSGLEEFQT